MSMTTIRPTSTVDDGTSSIGGGAGSRHAAVSDDSDATYVDITGTWPGPTIFGFSAPSLPAGSVIVAGILRARIIKPGGGSGGLGAYLNVGGAVGAASITVGPTALTPTLLGAYGDGTTLEAGLWMTGAGSVRVYEVYLDIYYVEKPTVDVTAPTGTLTETNRPTIEWTEDVDELTPWGYVEVKVFDDATYGAGGFDPSTDTGYEQYAEVARDVGTFTLGASLPNDTYRAYVRRIANSGSTVVTGDWDYIQFSVNVSPPDPPSAVATDEPAQGRVAIAVTPDNLPIATDGLLAERSIDGGETWETLRSGEIATGSAHTFYDYEAPSGVEVTYRISAWNDTVSDRLYSTPLTFDHTHAGDWWIKHPTDPSLNLALFMRSNPGYSTPVNQSETRVIGRSDPVFITDADSSDRGEITVLWETLEEQEAAKALLGTAVPLLLAGRNQDTWRDRWVVFGERGLQRLADQAWIPDHDMTLPWVEVERPDGDLE